MSPGQFLIREATAGEIDSIVAIERATPMTPHWGEEVYRRMLGRDSAGLRIWCVLVAVEQTGEDLQEVVGFAVAAAFRQESSGEGSPAELESVAVLDRARRRGIGRALCRASMVWAQRVCSPAMELEVRAENSAAVSLYRGLGFRETARRRGYYHDPEDTAVLMSVELGAPGTGA